jgi:hypothetical protein
VAYWQTSAWTWRALAAEIMTKLEGDPEMLAAWAAIVAQLTDTDGTP